LEKGKIRLKCCEGQEGKQIPYISVGKGTVLKKEIHISSLKKDFATYNDLMFYNDFATYDWFFIMKLSNVLV
jgi:hypothetical protein